MRVVLCTCPREKAAELARTLVERRLVACVNLLGDVRSFYWWEGEVQDDAEALLVLKTSDDAMPRVLAELPELHPYEVPEVISLPVVDGHPPYLDWVDAEARPKGA